MHRFLSAWIAVILTNWCSCAAVEAADEAKGEKSSVDYTEQAREMNSGRFASPPTKFKQGSVTPRSLDADKIKRDDSGFRIDLPTQAPIPTPTVYRKKLYVSGGFHSKEFYCFDAASANSSGDSISMTMDRRRPFATTA